MEAQQLDAKAGTNGTHFGAFLKSLREDRAIPQSELAAMAEMSAASIQRNEVREVAEFKRSSALAVLRSLNKIKPLSDGELGKFLALTGLSAGLVSGNSDAWTGPAGEKKVIAGPEGTVSWEHRDVAVSAGGLLRRLIEERELMLLDVATIACLGESDIANAMTGNRVPAHVLDRIFIALDEWKPVRPTDWIVYLRETFAGEGWDPMRCLRLFRSSRTFQGGC